MEDLRAHFDARVRRRQSDRYWSIFEALREELGYADYLGALQRYRLGVERRRDPRLLLDVVLPGRLSVCRAALPGRARRRRALRAFGPTVMLSDGDVVFQPRKIQRSGLWDAVEGRVLIYIHKERCSTKIERRYPARHYVMVDDKLRILAAMKAIWAAG